MRFFSLSIIHIFGGLAFFAFANQPAEAQLRTFIIDSDSSEFAFTVEHLGLFKVDGSFQESSGSVQVDLDRKLPVQADVELSVASINTDDDSRDENLRSDEFLDAERYPFIRFEGVAIMGSKSEIATDDSSRGRTEGGGRSEENQIEGQITIFGVTRDVQIPFTFEIDDETAVPTIVIRAQFKLSRDEFSLSFGRLMDAMVGDEISVRVRIVARAQA